MSIDTSTDRSKPNYAFSTFLIWITVAGKKMVSTRYKDGFITRQNNELFDRINEEHNVFPELLKK